MVNYLQFHFEKFIFVEVCGSLRSLLNIWIQKDQSLRTIKYKRNCPAVSVIFFRKYAPKMCCVDAVGWRGKALSTLSDGITL